MSKRKVLTLSLALLTTAFAGFSLAEDAPAPKADAPKADAPKADAPGGDRQRRSPEDWKKMMSDRMKEMMGASDDEWKVIAPRLEKVVTLGMQARGGGMMGMMRGRGGPGGGDQAPQSDIATKAGDLRKLLEDKDAAPADIKAKLAAFREARDKSKTELAAAQKDLREVISLRQESQLVMLGMLD